MSACANKATTTLFPSSDFLIESSHSLSSWHRFQASNVYVRPTNLTIKRGFNARSIWNMWKIVKCVSAWEEKRREDMCKAEKELKKGLNDHNKILWILLSFLLFTDSNFFLFARWTSSTSDNNPATYACSLDVKVICWTFLIRFIYCSVRDNMLHILIVCVLRKMIITSRISFIRFSQNCLRFMRKFKL